MDLAWQWVVETKAIGRRLPVRTQEAAISERAEMFDVAYKAIARTLSEEKTA
jgi:hypothetical protein